MSEIMSVLLDIDTSHLQFLNSIAITAVICFAILVVLGIFLLVSPRKDGRRNGLILGTALLLMSPVCVGGFIWAQMEIDEWRGEPHATYKLSLEPASDDVSVVFIPVPEDELVRSRFKVLSGDATIALQDQVHGKALKVVFSGDVSVGASADSEDGFTGTLTMKEEHEDSGREDYWINFQPPADADGNCSFYFRYSKLGGLGGGPHYRCEGFLEEGWNLYPGEYNVVAV